MGGRKGAPIPFCSHTRKTGWDPRGIYERFFRSFDHGWDFFSSDNNFLSNYFVADNNFFIFVESIRKSSLND